MQQGAVQLLAQEDNDFLVFQLIRRRNQAGTRPGVLAGAGAMDDRRERRIGVLLCQILGLSGAVAIASRGAFDEHLLFTFFLVVAPPRFCVLLALLAFPVLNRVGRRRN